MSISLGSPQLLPWYQAPPAQSSHQGRRTEEKPLRPSGSATFKAEKEESSPFREPVEAPAREVFLKSVFTIASCMALKFHPSHLLPLFILFASGKGPKEEVQE